MNAPLPRTPCFRPPPAWLPGSHTAVLDDRAYDSELAARLGRGDESALEALYDRYGGLGFTLAVRILNDRLLAEDVVQECFLSIWRSASGFDPGRSSFRSWFVTVVRNRCFDKLRGRAAQPKIAAEVEVADRPGADDVPGTVAQTFTAERVRSALAGLPPEQRETLELAYYGGLSHSEIADRMGVPLGTVKGRIRMAMGKLREWLSGLDQEDRA